MRSRRCCVIRGAATPRPLVSRTRSDQWICMYVLDTDGASLVLNGGIMIAVGCLVPLCGCNRMDKNERLEARMVQ